MAVKGGTFERDMSRLLSVWWSGDVERDDIFWRSSQSGGRATSRAKRGKKTAGHAGDLAATDPSGHKFIDVVTVEMKRGYQKLNIQDLIDLKPGKPLKVSFLEFVKQSIEAHERAGSYSWLLIQRRDSRREIVWMPMHLAEELRPRISQDVATSSTMRIKLNKQRLILYGLPLTTFTKWISPDDFKRVWKRRCRKAGAKTAAASAV